MAKVAGGYSASLNTAGLSRAFGKDGEPQAALSIDEHGGSFTAFGKDGEGRGRYSAPLNTAGLFTASLAKMANRLCCSILMNTAGLSVSVAKMANRLCCSGSLKTAGLSPLLINSGMAQSLTERQWLVTLH